MSWYSDADQTRHYRDVARDAGCTCPMNFPPHIHLIDCLYYVEVREVAEELERSHDADDGRPWL